MAKGTMVGQKQGGRYIMVRGSDDEIAELTAFARAAGHSYPAVWARTVLLREARKTKKKTRRAA